MGGLCKKWKLDTPSLELGTFSEHTPCEGEIIPLDHASDISPLFLMSLYGVATYKILREWTQKCQYTPLTVKRKTCSFH